MPTMSLGEVVRGGRLAEVVSEEGFTLRYRPELQRLGHGTIIEVDWPGAEGAGRLGLLEVTPDGWGGLSAHEANVPDDEPQSGARLRLPDVPTEGWRHVPDCDCQLCRT